MINRKEYTFRDGRVKEVEECPDGRYGARGQPRQKRRKATPEDMIRVNAWNKAKKCRHRLLTYFHDGDLFVTLTYRVQDRPPDMEAAKEDFREAMKYIRKIFKTRGKQLFWIRNIERGTKGGWHIHLVITEVGDTAAILKDAWPHGKVVIETIKDSAYYEKDMSQLADYMTKDEHTRERKENGELAKPRIKEASYSASRNMPLPEPHKDKLVRWKKEPKPRKGYYISKIWEGINPATGCKCRKYTMIRLEEDDVKNDKRTVKRGARGRPGNRRSAEGSDGGKNK